MTVVTAHISVPKPGEIANGDAVLVRSDPDGITLLAVIDGLGHGPVAAEASAAALQELAVAPLALPVIDLMERVHERLRSTRGAVGTICVVRGRTLEACAVGNVQLACLKTTVPLILSAGVLGHRIPRLRACSCELKRQTRIALASDGIQSRFRLDDFAQFSPEDACKAILTHHRRIDDDATVLIADMDV
jgi:negative regulator of sigma-B (phosphoserine phosphatase)